MVLLVPSSLVIRGYAMAIKISFVREVGACGQYFVHDDTEDPQTGTGYDLVQDARKAAMGTVKETSKANRKAVSAQKKAMNAADRATKAVENAANRAAEKLAAEEAVLAEKKARLDEMNAKGVFSLSMVG